MPGAGSVGAGEPAGTAIREEGENPRGGGGGEEGGNKGRQTPRRTAGGRDAGRATDCSFPSTSF